MQAHVCVGSSDVCGQVTAARRRLVRRVGPLELPQLLANIFNVRLRLLTLQCIDFYIDFSIFKRTNFLFLCLFCLIFFWKRIRKRSGGLIAFCAVIMIIILIIIISCWLFPHTTRTLKRFLLHISETDLSSSRKEK